jgi:hypothetical protein
MEHQPTKEDLELAAQLVGHAQGRRSTPEHHDTVHGGSPTSKQGVEMTGTSQSGRLEDVSRQRTQTTASSPRLSTPLQSSRDERTGSPAEVVPQVGQICAYVYTDQGI